MLLASNSIAQTNIKTEITNSPLPGQKESNAADTIIKNLLQRYADHGAEQLYEGTFIYLLEDQIQSFKVQRHLNEQGQVVEHFQPLDNSQNASSRILENRFCSLANGWNYQFQAISSSFPFRVNNFYRQLKQKYNFSITKKLMVAGKPAVLLSINAKDALRYSYQLWFEPKTAILLKYRLSDHQDKAIEQYVFTDINITSESSTDNSSYDKKEWTACAQKFSGMKQALKHFFKLNNVPESFEAISYRNGKINKSQRKAHQFQFSDGLSSVSVFIEDQKEVNKKINGVVKIGPMSVAGKSIGSHQITVLGAIPMDGAMQFLDSIKR